MMIKNKGMNEWSFEEEANRKLHVLNPYIDAQNSKLYCSITTKDIKRFKFGQRGGKIDAELTSSP